MMAMALAKELTSLPLRELGAHFGGVGPAAANNVVNRVRVGWRTSRRLAALRGGIERGSQNRTM